jgi:Flp pilus assembly pilin Flp
MLSILRALIPDEDGAAMVEYGLLLLLIAMVAFASVKTLGQGVSSFYNSAAGSV